MKVTRLLRADAPVQLAAICKTTGFLRADVWRRYGGLKGVGKNVYAICKEIRKIGVYSSLPIDGTLRNETTQDVVNDILTYKAAAKAKVRKSIARREPTNIEKRKRLFTLLRNDEWLSNNFLHHQMRKHFRHGVSHTTNQFIVRFDRHSSEVVNGQLVITIRIAKKYGDNVTLITTSSGKNVSLAGKNLRIILKDEHTEIHYATDKGLGREVGKQALGIDKGYTEAFVDSDGEVHGKAFGQVMTTYSDATCATGKQRNKLHALEKKHRTAGSIAKADKILKNNLGRKKINARKERAQQRLRTIAYQAAHRIVDKAEVVVSEDLTSSIKSKESKYKWKQYNRRMSSWAKGVLAEAMDSVCEQRGAKHTLVNCAYTSRIDSQTGLLQGKRVSDKFYCASGDVLQADHNAALNVLARLGDSDITRFTPREEVHRILLARPPAQQSVMDLVE